MADYLGLFFAFLGGVFSVWALLKLLESTVMLSILLFLR